MVANKFLLSRRQALISIAGFTGGIVLTNCANDKNSQTLSLERSFRNLGQSVGFNEESLSKFRKATDGTVSDIDLMIQANNALFCAGSACYPC